MPARRSAGHADPLRIDPKLRRVRPQPAHGSLHVMNRRRELEFRGQPVSNRGRHVTALRQLDAKRQITLARAGAKTSAMDAKHCGMRGVRAVARTYNV